VLEQSIVLARAIEQSIFGKVKLLLPFTINDAFKIRIKNIPLMFIKAFAINTLLSHYSYTLCLSTPDNLPSPLSFIWSFR
jgi:hypothetical protein